MRIVRAICGNPGMDGAEKYAARRAVEQMNDEMSKNREAARQIIDENDNSDVMAALLEDMRRYDRPESRK